VNGVILNSFIPVMIVALSWIFLHQRLRRLQFLGMMVSLCGVATLLSRGSLEELLAFRLNAGDLIVIVAMLLWAVYTLCLRLRPPGLHMLSFLFAIAVMGVLAMVPLYLGEHALGYTMTFGAGNLLALAYLGLFPSFIAYIFWNRGVELVGASVAGLFVHLMPVFGSLLAWIFIDEQLHAFHIAGMAAILAGLFLTTRDAPSAGPMD
jgi:drug/metabolite transporter (DMT)-like permease